MDVGGCKTVDPRIPTMPRRSTSGLFTDQPDIVSTKRETP